MSDASRPEMDLKLSAAEALINFESADTVTPFATACVQVAALSLNLFEGPKAAHGPKTLVKMCG